MSCHRRADALPVVERTFGTSDMLSLWIGLVVCLPSWYLAGSLVDMGTGLTVRPSTLRQ